jgi:hypothetical protein
VGNVLAEAADFGLCRCEWVWASVLFWVSTAMMTLMNMIAVCIEAY